MNSSVIRQDFPTKFDEHHETKEELPDHLEEHHEKQHKLHKSNTIAPKKAHHKNNQDHKISHGKPTSLETT